MRKSELRRRARTMHKSSTIRTARELSRFFVKFMAMHLSRAGVALATRRYDARRPGRSRIHRYPPGPWRQRGMPQPL